MPDTLETPFGANGTAVLRRAYKSLAATYDANRGLFDMSPEELVIRDIGGERFLWVTAARPVER